MDRYYRMCSLSSIECVPLDSIECVPLGTIIRYQFING